MHSDAPSHGRNSPPNWTPELGRRVDRIIKPRSITKPFSPASSHPEFGVDAMVAYFSGTIDALKKGVTKMSVSAAIRNIEHWEESLRDIELTGCRSILRDLGALKKQLQVDQPDDERIRHLMAKLASETVTISKKADARHSDKIAKLGEMLGHAAEGTESGADHQTRSDVSTSRSIGGNAAHNADGRFAKGNNSGGSDTSSPRSGNNGTDDSSHPRDDEGRYVKNETHHSTSSSSTAGSGRGNQAHDADGRFAKGNHAGSAKTSSPESGNHGRDDDTHPRDEDGRYVKSDTHRPALMDGDGREDRSR
jgi:hypothetical protein